ncbi:MAG: NAD-dependent epimerase/dehydratase [Verrucomicrobiales bacterium]|nr:NAD-dependent epimerase/dehydratase [Verrucomicrobiales bacterium]
MILSSGTVLITGVGGFLGRYIARHFASDGWDVVGVDRHALENAPVRSLKAYHAMELPSPAFRSLIETSKPTVCVHCAGRASVPQSVVDPVRDFEGNTHLTFEMLNTLRLFAPGCRMVFLSSAAVYGNPATLPTSETDPVMPVSPYGFHKFLGEQLVTEFYKVYGIHGASLRIFSAYGPGLRRQVLWDICYKALIENSVKLQGTGKETRDFIHATDIARAVLSIAKAAPMTGEVYNVASGREITIAELARCILKELRSDLILELDGVIPVSTPRNWRADISKLRSLGYEPSVPLETGIESFAAWARAELIG